MIIGVGTDIIEIQRVNGVIERNKRFLEKTFTGLEIEMFKAKAMKVETIAGNFAAKEAISKAVGSGFRDFSFKDIEVLRDELGKPIVNLSEKVINKIGSENIKINLSISHNKSSAIAFAILEV